MESSERVMAGILKKMRIKSIAEELLRVSQCYALDPESDSDVEIAVEKIRESGTRVEMEEALTARRWLVHSPTE